MCVYIYTESTIFVVTGVKRNCFICKLCVTYMQCWIREIGHLKTKYLLNPFVACRYILSINKYFLFI